MAHQRHKPEDTALHKLVRENLWGFLQQALEETGKRMPSLVVEAWRRYLTCGLGGAGFRRRQCEDCGHEEITCFSCKTRQLCPSCSARQMAEGAMKLVETVLPVAPVRQYVLSLPFELWGILGYRTKLMNRVQMVFCHVVQQWTEERT
jgi:ribosomal protein S27E